MRKNKTNEKIQILAMMNEYGFPVGSIYLSERMKAAPATIGRLLIELENEGLISKIGVKGRVLTPAGEEFLNCSKERQYLQASADKLANMHLNLSKKILIDTLDMRLLLEPLTAELACRHGTEEQICQLDQASLEYKLHVLNGEMGDEPGMRMHLILAQMSGNEVLSNICTLLLAQNQVQNILFQIAEKEEVLAAQVAEHAAIVAAVKERNAEAARRLLYEHIARSRSYVLDLPD